jgi:hypothetical protein
MKTLRQRIIRLKLVFYADKNKSEGEKHDASFIYYFYSYGNERNIPLI